MSALLDTTKISLLWFLKCEQPFDNIRTYKANGGANDVT